MQLASCNLKPQVTVTNNWQIVSLSVAMSSKVASTSCNVCLIHHQIINIIIRSFMYAKRTNLIKLKLGIIFVTFTITLHCKTYCSVFLCLSIYWQNTKKKCFVLFIWKIKKIRGMKWTANYAMLYNISWTVLVFSQYSTMYMMKLFPFTVNCK